MPRHTYGGTDERSAGAPPPAASAAGPPAAEAPASRRWLSIAAMSFSSALVALGSARLAGSALRARAARPSAGGAALLRAGAARAASDTPSLTSYAFASATCVLCAELTLALDRSDKDAQVTVRYGAADGSTAALWAGAVAVDADGGAVVPFCRLRASTEYAVDVYYSSDGDGDAELVASGLSHTSGATGYTAFDTGPYASAGEGAFDFELLATFTALVDGPDVFTGVVLLDAEGWVVWYLSLPYDEDDEDSLGETGYAVYDWVPDSYDLVVLRAVNNYWDLSPSLLAQLSEVTPLGDVAAEYDDSCSGDVTNFNQVSHECKIDTGDTTYPALSLMYVLRDDFGDADGSGLCDIQESLCEQWEDLYGDDSDVGWLGMSLVSWDRTAAAPTTLYDLFDYWNPGNTEMDDDPNFSLMSMRCGGDDDGDVKYGVDYHHGSSVAVDPTTSDYVVTLRNLNTIAAFKRDGSGLRWTLSSSLASNFTFATDEMKFYDPHDVTVWAPSSDSPGSNDFTTITVVDDGNSRPGCDWDDASKSGCFSRALEYVLDTETMTARVLWQFEFPQNLQVSGLKQAESFDVFNEVGGSVTKLTTGSGSQEFLVSLTAVYNDDESDASDDGYLAYVYQVDTEGDAGAWMALPALPSWATAGRYRVVPRSSVYGESEHCPFGGVDTADASRLENSANATSHPRTPPGDAVDDDLVNDQMPVNVGITDDGAAAAQSEASGAVTEPSFLKQLGIRLGYALRPGPSFRR